MNRVVLITGAARGLGLCLTQKYLKEGDMVFAGIRDMSAPSIKNLQKDYPDMLVPIILEVTDTESVEEAAETMGKYTNQLDILINNAAIHSKTSFELLENTDLDECLEVYDVNSLGPIRVVKAFLPYLRKSKASKVINISSESGSIETSWREKEFDYCMSKAALNMGTKLLSNYLKKDNAIVICIHPGWMRTEMGGSNAELDPYETACKLVELFDTINDNTPLFIDNNGNTYPW